MTRNVDLLNMDLVEAVGRFVHAMADGLDAGRREEWAARLGRMARLTPFTDGQILVEHHAVAEDLHFLIRGRLRYRHVVTDPGSGEEISDSQVPWMPIGWSSLHFRRYRVTVVADGEGMLLSLPLDAWGQVAEEDPALSAALSAFTFRTAIHMLWESRGLHEEVYVDVAPTTVRPPLAIGPEPEALNEMYRRSPCFSALPAECRRWLAASSRTYQVEAGQRVLQEGEATDGLWLLQLGRLALRFTVVTEQGRQTAVRFAVRPGTLVCWSAVGELLPAPYEVEATRGTKLVHVPRTALAELVEQHPEWLTAIFQQQLWQLRRYLVSTRTHYGDASGDGGIRSVGDLIEDSKPILPVNSPLYGVPYLLTNHLTRQDGFDRLYRAHLEGTPGEQSVASLSLDLVRGLERGHRFFEGMQRTYAAVVRSQHLQPAELRRLSSRYFRDALAHVPYAIKGWEHLPEDPNCIFIYNHMAYAEDSILPNGFLFNPDSHFMSGIILEPRYGDGIRVARANDTTEFWRADYYERLGHLSVVTPESGWRDLDAEERQQRKERFLSECQAVLASGRPFSIAPEGTITEEDSRTEVSPGPLKAGAFLMSGRFPSKPRIVPVAFANFDKPAHDTVFACVIKPPFRMEDRGVDVEDREQMAAFLESYRQEFRGHVEEAIELAQQVQAPEADLSGVVTNLGEVDAVNEEFEHDVRSLELQAYKPGDGTPATVCYGSSTFRMWEGLAADLAVPDVVNLGFGGSTLEACRLYFERLVLPYEPTRLLIYCGENDIGRGASADFVSTQFAQFADKVHSHLPETVCWFVSIKPSPDRADHMAEIEKANGQILAEVERRDQWRYVDWFPYLLDEQGEPNGRMFGPDRVHVNVAGYGILGKLLREALRAG